MANKNIKALIIILAFIVVGAVIFFAAHQKWQQSLTPIQASLPQAVQINTENQPTLGDPKAPIHIVAFEDFKCSDCMNYNVLLFPQIKKQLIDTNQAKYTFISLSFLQGSMQAANTARCLYVQNSKYFFQFVDYIYHHQGPESENWANIPWLLQAGNLIQGVDANKLNNCVMQSPYIPFIQNNYALAKKIMGTVHAPKVYINGILVEPLSMQQINLIIQHIRQNPVK